MLVGVEMAITIIERSRQTGEAHYKRPVVTRDYLAFDSFDRNEIILALANGTPQFDSGIDLQTGQAIALYRNKVEVREANGGGGKWDCVVRYESSSDSVEISFDFGMQTGKVYQSLENVAGYSCDAPGGVMGTDIPDFEGAIGVTSDGKIEGVDIEVGNVNFTVTKRWKRAILPATYFTTIADITDRSSVNHASYSIFWMGQNLTFTRGNLRIRSVSIKQNSDEELEISYHFHYARPIVAADNYTVRASAAIEKEGHQYMWPYHREEVSAGTSIRIVEAVYIEQVYEYKDFSLLNI